MENLERLSTNELVQLWCVTYRKEEIEKVLDAQGYIFGWRQKQDPLCGDGNWVSFMPKESEYSRMNIPEEDCLWGVEPSHLDEEESEMYFSNALK